MSSCADHGLTSNAGVDGLTDMPTYWAAIVDFAGGMPCPRFPRSLTWPSL